ncbi:glutamate mutase subunit E, partial [Halovivax asiaticus JCM 14624]
MVRDEQLSSDELATIDESIRAEWPTGEAATVDDAIAFHEGLPASKEFATVLESATEPLLQPRAGVCLLYTSLSGL